MQQSTSLDEVNGVLNQGYPIDDSVPPTVLRQRRAALTPTWICVSYAIEVLAVDLQVLNRHKRSDKDHLQAIIDDMPDFLAGSWDNSGWSYSVDTSELIATAADTDGLLDLHQELVSSDLDDPSVARSLLARMKIRKSALMKRKHRLEKEIKQIQAILLRQYAAGVASADDWLG
jgi:hypothetical protein